MTALVYNLSWFTVIYKKKQQLFFSIKSFPSVIFLSFSSSRLELAGTIFGTADVKTTKKPIRMIHLFPLYGSHRNWRDFFHIHSAFFCQNPSETVFLAFYRHYFNAVIYSSTSWYLNTDRNENLQNESRTTIEIIMMYALHFLKVDKLYTFLVNTFL